MRTVTFCVSTLDEFRRRMSAAFDGSPQEPRIAFVSYELMYKMLTPKRMELLQAMMGQGPLGVRELARRVKRDVANVHADIEALAKGGVINRIGDKVEFPYDNAHLDLRVAPEAASQAA